MRYTVLPFLPVLASAWQAATYQGLNLVWSDDFTGPSGAPPGNQWNIAQAIHSNNEVQVYTTSSNNLQISGGSTIQFVPRRSPSGQWTSGRIESKASFTPQPGQIMQIEASISLGNNGQGNKQGIWPAFWMMGDAVRHGTGWPQCGEIDIFEQVNGAMTGYGTVHCGTFPGGICAEPSGKAGTVGIPDNGFHTWTVRIDRTINDWTREVIYWLLDGRVYFSLSGAQLGDQAVWSTLAHSPMYIILDLAVGGDWPGAPNGATMDGYGSMMEVGYVGVYTS